MSTWYMYFTSIYNISWKLYKYVQVYMYWNIENKVLSKIIYYIVAFINDF